MISIICYGRNDSHGYNLAKRAALSFNCLAEVLDSPGDEIIFVDCNTEDHYATFPESIQDTLTPRARSLLKVFRVRRSLYEKRSRGSKFQLLESFSRNVALRRANPTNRWVLSTNPDMVLIPGGGGGLGILLGDLPDGYYATPRYEVPEMLWEDLPRADPATCMRVISQSMADGLHFAVGGEPWNGFDAPGDFQLLPLKHAVEIGGFHELMTRGWHVDSNFAKRCSLFYGAAAKPLVNEIRGYHLMHLRTLSSAHTGKAVSSANSIAEFVTEVTAFYPQGQPADWGAPELEIEYVPLRTGADSLDPKGHEAAAAADAVEFGGYSGSTGYGESHYANLRRVSAYLKSEFQHFPSGLEVFVCSGNPEMMDLMSQLAAAKDWRLHSISLSDAEERLAQGQLNKMTFDVMVLDFTLHFARLEAGKPAPAELRKLAHRLLLNLLWSRCRAVRGNAPETFYCLGVTHSEVELRLLEMPCSWDAIPFAIGFKRGRLERSDGPAAIDWATRWREEDRSKPRDMDEYWQSVCALARRFDRTLDRTAGPVETGAAMRLEGLADYAELAQAAQIILHKDVLNHLSHESIVELARDYRPVYSNPVFVLLRRGRSLECFCAKEHRLEWSRLLELHGVSGDRTRARK